MFAQDRPAVWSERRDLNPGPPVPQTILIESQALTRLNVLCGASPRQCLLFRFPWGIVTHAG